MPGLLLETLQQWHASKAHLEQLAKEWIDGWEPSVESLRNELSRLSDEHEISVRLFFGLSSYIDVSMTEFKQLVQQHDVGSSVTARLVGHAMDDPNAVLNFVQFDCELGADRCYQSESD